MIRSDPDTDRSLVGYGAVAARSPHSPFVGMDTAKPLQMLRLPPRQGRKVMRMAWIYRLSLLVALLLAAGAGNKWGG
jgi:hypothetical protein